MTLHIVEFPEEVIREAKGYCLNSGESLRDFVIRAIRAEVEIHRTGRGKFGPGPEIQIKDSPRDLTVEEREMLTQADARKRKVEPVAPEPERAFSGHDTESCKLYGCLQCKIAGVKNPKRGL